MSIFDLLKWLAQPVVRVAAGVTGVVSVLAGTVLDPEGAVNSFLVRLIDFVAIYWPSTPDGLTIAGLYQTATASNTVGGYVVWKVATTATAMLGVVLAIKVYKLIPFKAT